MMDKTNSGVCKNCNNHIREKLVELLDEAKRPYTKDGDCCFRGLASIADHLIANNVTVQEWIPVTERMPEEDTRVLVWLAPKHYEYTNVDTDRRYRGRWVRWDSRVTHWMPLPEAPKGE